MADDVGAAELFICYEGYFFEIGEAPGKGFEEVADYCFLGPLRPVSTLPVTGRDTPLLRLFDEPDMCKLDLAPLVVAALAPFCPKLLPLLIAPGLYSFCAPDALLLELNLLYCAPALLCP